MDTSLVRRNLLSPRRYLFLPSAVVAVLVGSDLEIPAPACPSSFPLPAVLASLRVGVELQQSGLGLPGLVVTVLGGDGECRCWCRSTCLFCAQAGARTASNAAGDRRQPITDRWQCRHLNQRRRAFLSMSPWHRPTTASWLPPALALMEIANGRHFVGLLL